MVSDSSDSRSLSSSAASPGRAAAAAAAEELEAAEALADFAHLAMREGSGGDCGRRWNKRVKSESTQPRELAESPTRCSDLPQERVVSHQQYERASKNMLTEPLKAENERTEKNLQVEKNNKLPNTSLVGSTVYSSLGCGKSRRNLTEAEKEARKLRRILANRESARQTIRRRQALCEELTKKAADLSLENDSLRRDLETALKEYQILETTNKELKDQMAEVVKAEVEEIPGGHKPACVHITPSSALPLFLYSHPPFTPIFWPPVSQSQNPIQVSHLPQSAIIVPSNLPFPVEGQHDACENDNLKNPSGPRSPFYILPCPWFFPRTDHGSAVQSQSSNFQKTEQEETFAKNQCSVTSSRTASHLETAPSFLPIKLKTEPSVPLEVRIAEDLNELPAGFSQDGGDQQTVCQYEGKASKEPSLASSPVKYLSATANVKHENRLQLDPTPHSKTSSEASHMPSALPEKYCEPIYLCKKSAEAVAAAEARKRRKELTKLKNLHGRQCRMHC